MSERPVLFGEDRRQTTLQPVHKWFVLEKLKNIIIHNFDIRNKELFKISVLVLNNYLKFQY